MCAIIPGLAAFLRILHFGTDEEMSWEKKKSKTTIISSTFWGEGIASSPLSSGSPILSTNTRRDQGAWRRGYLWCSYQDCWRVIVVEARLRLLCSIEERLLHWVDELVVVQPNRCREMLQLFNRSSWKDYVQSISGILDHHCIYLHSTNTLWKLTWESFINKQINHVLITGLICMSKVLGLPWDIAQIFMP